MNEETIQTIEESLNKIKKVVENDSKQQITLEEINNKLNLIQEDVNKIKKAIA